MAALSPEEKADILELIYTALASAKRAFPEAYREAEEELHGSFPRYFPKPEGEQQ